MTDPFRALCAELVDELENWIVCGDEFEIADAHLLIDRARTLLAQPEPEGPSNRIASIAKALQECALAWEPDARLVGNVRAEDIADLCSALLARRLTPQPPADGEVG